MATSRFNDPEMVENIDHLESNLIAYESGLSRGQDDTSQVQFIFRYAHNLKSSLGMLGFSGASALLHKVESCFDLVRNAKKRATADLTRTALLVLDLVRENLQAPAGSAFPDAAAIEAVLESFIASEAEGDLSIALPFPLGMEQARAVVNARRAGQHLWLIDKLITTNIDAEFFGMLPCFDQARSMGELIEHHPHWEQMPKDQPEAVLRLLVASHADHAEFGKQIHDSFRQVREPAVGKVFLARGLPPEVPAELVRLGFKPAEDWPAKGPALVVVGTGDPSLTARGGRRGHGVLALAMGDFSTGIQSRLACLDAGADAVATDVYELQRELLWLECLFYTGLGGEHDH